VTTELNEKEAVLDFFSKDLTLSKQSILLDRRQGLKHDDVFPQYYELISTNQAYARNDLQVSI